MRDDVERHSEPEASKKLPAKRVARYSSWRQPGCAALGNRVRERVLCMPAADLSDGLPLSTLRMLPSGVICEKVVARHGDLAAAGVCSAGGGRWVGME